MRKPTELMRSILKNEMSQRIIDFVSPIYGNSYVALWIYEAIGIVLNDVYTISDNLRYETSASTTEMLMDYWEYQYGLPKDNSLTLEQRRYRLLLKKRNGLPANPKKLSDAMSAALDGAAVDITENVDKNTFLVNIRDVVPSYTPAVAVIERRKPAHLIYRVRSCAVSDVKVTVGVAVAHSEQYEIRVEDDRYANADFTVAVAFTHSEQYKVEV